MLIVQKKRHHNAEVLRERDELEIYLLGELKLVFVSSELSFVQEYNNSWSQTRNKEHKNVCSPQIHFCISQFLPVASYCGAEKSKDLFRGNLGFLQCQHLEGRARARHTRMSTAEA